MKLTKRSLLAIGILIVVLCIGFVVFLNSSTAATENAVNEDLTKYVELQKNEIYLKKELGNNTPYPRLYMMAEALVELKGVDSEKAIAQATERYVEKQALVWYAEKNGISTTALELEQHINSLIESAKRAENYDELNSAYKSVGLSVEKLYRENVSYYRDDYIIGKLYDQWISNNAQGKEFSESKMKSIDAAWERLISEVTASYKESKNYKELRPALTGSKKMFNEGIGKNEKILKKAGIFISDEESK